MLIFREDVGNDDRHGKADPKADKERNDYAHASFFPPNSAAMMAAACESIDLFSAM
jgi:hypothetical protein